MPQGIGSAFFQVDEADDTSVLSVGPIVAANIEYSHSRVMYSMSEYSRFLLGVKRRSIEGMQPEESQRAETVISLMEKHVIAIAESIHDPSLLRHVLVHADPHGHNILVGDNGDITGIVDWEFNYILPAILAVDYPLWLSSAGRLDPRFASDFQLWEESPPERQRLCHFFETVSFLILGSNRSF